ncbi:uncharacterized protein LOC144125613 [Amblyomma americanum]
MVIRRLAKHLSLIFGLTFLFLEACAEDIICHASVGDDDGKGNARDETVQIVECTYEPISCRGGTCNWNRSRTCTCRLRCSAGKSSCVGTSGEVVLVAAGQTSSSPVPRASWAPRPDSTHHTNGTALRRQAVTEIACRAVGETLTSDSDDTWPGRNKRACDVCRSRIFSNIECQYANHSPDIRHGRPNDTFASANINSSLEASHSYAVVDAVVREFAHSADKIAGATSFFFLLLKVFVYAADRSSRCFISGCALCYALTLLTGHLIGYVCLATIHLMDGRTFLATLLSLKYCSQSSFLWTLVLSFDITRALTVSKRALRSSKTLVLYSTFAWGTPGLLFLLAYLLQCYTGSGRGQNCFSKFSGGRALLITCAVAPLIVAIFNFSLYAYTIVSVKRCKATPNKIERQNATRRRSLLLFVRLAFIMWATAVCRLIVSLPRVVPNMKGNPSAMIVYNAAYFLSVMLGSVPGVYLFFGFNDHKILWRMISKQRLLLRRFRVKSLFWTQKQLVPRIAYLPEVCVPCRRGQSGGPVETISYTELNST